MHQPETRTTSHRLRWKEKAVLRRIYADLYERIAVSCVDGSTLEIGGGSGNFKEFHPDAWSCDIVFAPWLDFAADAQSLPVAANTLSNVVMFDVLHHIEFPTLFFEEAHRILRPGGRIVMVEPAITPISSPFYRIMHPEPVRMGVDPFARGLPDRQRDVFDANQALPTLIVGRHRKRFHALFPGLRILTVDWISLLAYPLSGGFQNWSAIPAFCVKPFLKIENLLSPFLGRLMAFRMLIVVEKTSRD